MAKHPPRLFLVLLALVVGSRLAFISVYAALVPALLWPLLIAALGIGASVGKRRAAIALGFVLFALGALSVLSPLVQPLSTLALAYKIVWGTFALGTAAYMYESRALRQFYAPTPSPL
jgi:hypothetical protein